MTSNDWFPAYRPAYPNYGPTKNVVAQQATTAYMLSSSDPSTATATSQQQQTFTVKAQK